MSDFDHLEMIADSSRPEPVFNTPKGRSRKFRLAAQRNCAKFAAARAKRPKWKRQMTGRKPKARA